MQGLDAFIAWLKQLQFDVIEYTLLALGATLLCITVHETCHGLVAYWLGDRTAKNAGRLTLNPLKHIDLIGLVMMAFCQFGWAKPVPVDMRNFQHPKRGMALTALAGPVSNLLLGYLAHVLALSLMCLNVVVHSGFWSAVLEFLSLFFRYVEIFCAGLVVFNLFPIQPLDGSKIVFSLLPDRWYLKLMRYERFGALLLVALLFFGVLDKPLVSLRDGLLNFWKLTGRWSYDLFMILR